MYASVCQQTAKVLLILLLSYLKHVECFSHPQQSLFLCFRFVAVDRTDYQHETVESIYSKWLGDNTQQIRSNTHYSHYHWSVATILSNTVVIGTHAYLLHLWKHASNSNRLRYT